MITTNILEPMLETVEEKIGDRCTLEFLQWLADAEYFTCPAAKRHHGNFETGLYQHSLAVAEELDFLTSHLHLMWDRPESPWVVGLLHDICKTDDYVFNDEEVDGETKFVISMNSNMKYSGHGSKSLIMLSGHIELTEEEKICIAYHMGAFTDKEEWQYYSRAVQRYPNVLYTHTADMIASQIRGI